MNSALKARLEHAKKNTKKGKSLKLKAGRKFCKQRS